MNLRQVKDEIVGIGRLGMTLLGLEIVDELDIKKCKLISDKYIGLFIELRIY